MICHDRKLIFIHIPKCGGTSVENCLWPPAQERTESMLWMGFVAPFFNKYQTGGLQHLTARHIRLEVGASLFSEYFKFAICRHPVDRIISQFKFMSRRPDLRNFIGLGDAYDFDEYLERITLRRHVQWMPQVDFIQDEDGMVIVDKLYKLEDISKSSTQFASDVGINVSHLPRENSTDDVCRPKLTARHMDRIMEIYQRDYEVLGYSCDRVPDTDALGTGGGAGISCRPRLQSRCVKAHRVSPCCSGG